MIFLISIEASNHTIMGFHFMYLFNFEVSVVNVPY
jgi:hypothetical protein